MSCCTAKTQLIQVELLYAKLIQADLGQDLLSSRVDTISRYVVYNDVSVSKISQMICFTSTVLHHFLVFIGRNRQYIFIIHNGSVFTMPFRTLFFHPSDHLSGCRGKKYWSS